MAAMKTRNNGLPEGGSIWFLLAAFTVQVCGQGTLALPPSPPVRGVLNNSLPLEEKAYHRFDGPFFEQGNYKSEYMKQLSPGGKVYFLACRHDYAEALEALKKLPKTDTGSALYVKAFCLVNLGKNKEAAAAFAAAKSKIGKDFNPGFRFYLQSSRAALLTGDDKGSLKDLKSARAKASENALDTAIPGRLSPLLDRRTIYVYEYKGKYKEAFEGYLSMFNIRGDQFNLQGPIAADPVTRKKAAAWLKNNSLPPKDSSDVETAKFFLTQGKAYLAVGNINAAKTSLDKASEVCTRDLPLISSQRVVAAEKGKLRGLNDQARIILVKLCYLDKNYQKGCYYLRRLFAKDPKNEVEQVGNIITMTDVPQLVQEKDMKLHTREFENVLDNHELVAYSPNAWQVAQTYSFSNDPTLLKASAYINAGRFSECYDTLEKFIAENSQKMQGEWSFRQASRKFAFQAQFEHVARLLRIPVGIAAERSERGLSLAFNPDYPASAQWLAIEDVLLGKKMRDPKNASSGANQLSAKEFDDCCHFAAAARAMDKKDFKAAVKEFARIGAPQPKDVSLVPSFARALKKWCEQQKN
jgi:hypothetical protein